VAGFWERAHAFYTGLGITVTRVMTDNGSCYRSRLFIDTLGETITHKYTRPYPPQANGKICEDLSWCCAGFESDPGQGVTTVSFVRFVDWARRSTTERAGQTDLT
jgi:hypothetical protein